ncbi:Ig-like domain-containing protein [Paenibacillus lignilyticus]|uniref:Big-1 domain-containing protein n=1 Tax=Paenibacillus lignilyticus TaxID=1172615 RepID=A0ABS5CA16_9BACL|nr:hypothetical protein [Paenibacillus lignilyticus]MBP3962670.1 hypothetical protein [Paenibacillus lignilyticus]
MKRKLGVLLCCAVIAGFLLIMWRMDSNREVLFSVKLSKDELKANGKDEILVEFTVTDKDGKPRSGDDVLVIKAKGYGSTKVTRVKTDENGRASFVYYSYNENEFQPAVLNQILLSDVSVGKVIGVYKRAIVDIPVISDDSLDKASEHEDDGKDKNSENDEYIELN